MLICIYYYFLIFFQAGSLFTVSVYASEALHQEEIVAFWRYAIWWLLYFSFF